MSEDLVSLLIYLALGLVGVIASAYKNKAKKQQMNKRPGAQVPRTFSADPQKDFEPELGPLIELFDLPKREPEPEYESIEYGPSVEESEMKVESETGSHELAGMGHTAATVDTPVSEVETFEEGQSDIQKMIAKYEALRKDMDEDGLGDDISSSQIVSVEAEEEARLKKMSASEFFNARKAIIYSEILKRREF